MSKTKLISAGIAAALIIAGIYFKQDIPKLLEGFGATQTAVEKAIKAIGEEAPAK